MVSRRLIGTATTDSNGNAVLEDGYTGTGAGLVDIIAQTTIDEQSVVSQPYDVLDCIFYDEGIVNPNTNWDCAYVTRSEETNGTKFLATSTSASARASMNPLDNSTAYDFTPQPMVFEADIVAINIPSGDIGMQFIQQNPPVNKQIKLTANDVGHNIKIKYTGTALECYVDDVHQSNRDITVSYHHDSELMRIGFSLYAQNGYVIVKNVKAYPI